MTTVGRRGRALQISHIHGLILIGRGSRGNPEAGPPGNSPGTVTGRASNPRENGLADRPPPSFVQPAGRRQALCPTFVINPISGVDA